MTPEEKLLRAILVRKQLMLKIQVFVFPPSVKGTVVEIRVFSRRGIEKDERAISIENHQIENVARDKDDELNILEKSFANYLRDLLVGKPIWQVISYKKILN